MTCPATDTMPRLRALLVELLDLESGDGHLPLEILVRLNPAVLRAGLEHLSQQNLLVPIEYRVRQASDLLATRYPGLKDGVLFQTSTALAVLEEVHDRSYGYALDTKEDAAPLVRLLVEGTAMRWVTYQPLSTMYLLGVRPEALIYLGARLETELGLHADVRRMILDCTAGF